MKTFNINSLPAKPLAASGRVSTAVLLAAGTGSRLRPLTLNAPKCLTVVAGKPILQRLLDNLRAQGIKKLIVATGYLDKSIEKYLQQHATDMKIEYVFNADYQTTNNIYSLWLTKDAVKEPFLLVECDLVFDTPMLTEMMYPDRIAISNMLPWMNGTTVTLTPSNEVSSFQIGSETANIDAFKTVNICSFSLKSWEKVLLKLEEYISAGRINSYYESVFAGMAIDKSLVFDAVFFQQDRWYEVDTLADLEEADKLFEDDTNTVESKELIA